MIFHLIRIAFVGIITVFTLQAYLHAESLAEQSDLNVRANRLAAREQQLKKQRQAVEQWLRELAGEEQRIARDAQAIQNAKSLYRQFPEKYSLNSLNDEIAKYNDFLQTFGDKAPLAPQ